jgi:hypothetical protein
MLNKAQHTELHTVRVYNLFGPLAYSIPINYIISVSINPD